MSGPARPKLRVVMTADAVGGVWSYAIDLARGLRSHNVQTLVALAGPAPSDDQRASADRAEVQLTTLDGPLDWLDATPDTLAAQAAALTTIAAGWDADLIQLNSPILAAVGDFELPVLGFCHSDLATWWATVKGDEVPERFAWRIDMTGRGYDACDALIAPTHAFAAATAQAFGVSPQIVLNGRATSHVADAARQAGSILAVGRLWDSGKGMAVLDTAATRMTTPVAAAGATQSPDGDRIDFRAVQPLGRLDAAVLAARMASTDIFVSPAFYEPFGLAVLEAAQAGAALVLSDIPSHRELWADAALLVPPGDAAVLAETLDALATDPARARALGAKAAVRAAVYSVERMASATAAIQRSLVTPRLASRMAVGA